MVGTLADTSSRCDRMMRMTRLRVGSPLRACDTSAPRKRGASNPSARQPQALTPRHSVGCASIRGIPRRRKRSVPGEAFTRHAGSSRRQCLPPSRVLPSFIGTTRRYRERAEDIVG